MTCEVLQTGSSGNCVILNGVIALDMGVAYKRSRPMSGVCSLSLYLMNTETTSNRQPSAPLPQSGLCSVSVAGSG